MGKAACRGKVVVADYCKSGYEAALCARCSAGYLLASDFKCRKCGASTGDGAMIFAAFVVSLGLAYRAVQSPRIVALWQFIWKSLKLHLKNVWSMIGCLAYYPTMLRTKVPPGLARLYSMLGFSKINPLASLGLSCANPYFSSFEAQLRATTLFPFVIALLLCGVHVTRTRLFKHDRQSSLKALGGWLLMLCFVTLPPVSAVVFQTYLCDHGP